MRQHHRVWLWGSIILFALLLMGYFVFIINSTHSQTYMTNLGIVKLTSQSKYNILSFLSSQTTYLAATKATVGQTVKILDDVNACLPETSAKGIFLSICSHGVISPFIDKLITNPPAFNFPPNVTMYYLIVRSDTRINLSINPFQLDQNVQYYFNDSSWYKYNVTYIVYTSNTLGGVYSLTFTPTTPGFYSVVDVINQDRDPNNIAPHNWVFHDTGDQVEVVNTQTAPIPPSDIWSSISNIWTNLWSWIRGLFT